MSDDFEEIGMVFSVRYVSGFQNRLIVCFLISELFYHAFLILRRAPFDTRL